MTCDACARAKVTPRTGRFNAGCNECAARSIAGEPEFFESVEANAITSRYRDRLQQFFGAGWVEGHESVKRWSEQMRKVET